GQPKLLERCTYPLTGAGVVTRVYTNLGVVDITRGCFVLQEIAPGIDVETVRSLTAGRLLVAEDLRELRVS
ncbi:MAG: hypothetical protein ACR2RL_09895, partial [Gammaproteobacteria bacterium]